MNFDLIDMGKSYNGHKWVSHMGCSTSGFQLGVTHARKDDSPGIIERTISFIKKHYNTKIRFFHLDGETSITDILEKKLANQGIKVERTAPDTPAQNGHSEKSGHLITIRARSMAIDAHMPTDMWPEAYKTSIYLGNITPRKNLDWQSPYEFVTKHKPMLAHLHPYGCKAYAIRKNIPRRDKLLPRNFIGYFVGYDSTNIFRIWIPSRNQVIRTRDVEFDHESRYSPYDIDIGALINVSA